MMPRESISIRPDLLANRSPRYPATIVVVPLVTLCEVASSPNWVPLRPRSSLMTARMTD